MILPPLFMGAVRDKLENNFTWQMNQPMKKSFLLCILLTCYLFPSAFSQAPQAFTYQAVVRNNSGDILANQLVALRISILNTSNSGPVVYQERHTPTSNALGLIDLNIGQGSVLSGSFSSINWGVDSKYIQIELDPAGGTNYSIMGTTQLLSVPYAMYANQSANAGGGGIANGISSGNTTYWNGSAWVVNSSTLYNNGSEIGIGTTTPDPSAALEIGGTTKGFLMPRMTTIQRDAIPSPALGLQIFNLDDYCIDIYDGSNWIKSCGMKMSGVVTDAQHPAANTWVQKAFLNTSGGRSHAFAFTIGTKAYVGTGNSMSGLLSDFWEYNSENNSWTQKANFPGGPRSEAVAFSIGTKGYVCSGNSGSYVNYDMWEYDPQTDTWTARSNCPGSARTKAQGFAIGSKGYLGLGTDGSTDLNDFWEYDPQTDAWSAKANYPGSGRRYTMGLSVQGKGYIGLGTDANGNYYGDVWEFNPGTNTWLAKNNFPGSGFHSMACFTMNQLGYIGTGYNGTNAMTDFWEYNTSTDTWTTKALFSGTSRQNAVGFAIGNKGYISTGLFSLMTLTDVWEYMDNNVVGNAYTTASIGNTNSVSDGAWTIFNNQLYNSNNGNVGIGNSSPTNKLSVTGNADIDGSLGIGLNNPQAQHKLSVLGNSFFNGNVGIGYAFPGNKLSVLGNADFSGNVGIGVNNPLEQLHTAGTVRHESLMGIGIRPVMADGNGKLTVYNEIGTVSNSTAQSIPANTSCGMATSSIVVSGLPGNISTAGISVKFNVTIASTSTLRVYLIAPNGNVLRLVSPNTAFGQNFTNTIITDNSGVNISTGIAPFSGSYRPSGVLGGSCVAGTVTKFADIGGGNINPNGIWQLKVENDNWPVSGTLNNWSITFGNNPIGSDGYFPKWNNNALSTTSNLIDEGPSIRIEAPLHFPNTAINKKIALWMDANNENQFYGFGIGYSALRYQVAHTGASHIFYAGTSSFTSNELMRIGGDGKVSIGSVASTPGGYKLFVQGGILTERLKVAINGSGSWADYVFKDDYKLLSLDQVERFIKANGHLPNVPSAEELAETGLDIAIVNAKLMEKIEELTLYLIEMKKEIEELKEHPTRNSLPKKQKQ